jgi:cyanuric acid amidohydrolase
MAVEIKRFEMAAPDDTAQLEALLSNMPIRSLRRLAVIAKTEGTATVNDFSRSLGQFAISAAFAKNGIPDEARTQVILSTGCEGIITPGGYLIADLDGVDTSLPGLAVGVARSQPLAPFEMITAKNAEIARETVAAAIADAGVRSEDVALVFMKTPLLTSEMARDLSAQQRERANRSGLARGIAALGIAAALGEIDAQEIDDSTVGRRVDLYSRMAMVFSGTETRACEAIVLANKPGYPSAVRSAQIEDLIDIDGMARIIAPDRPDAIEAAREVAHGGRIVAAFLKAGIAPSGRLRGNRTTAFTSECDPDKHMRAAGSGVIGALLGDTRFFVSGGAEHQAPPGGGVFAVVLAR